MASMTISLFQATIDQIVYLAILMPIVASMGGVAGTQTLAIYDLDACNKLINLI